jgi:hypothetical protein
VRGEDSTVHGCYKEVSLLAQNGSSAGIPFAHYWTSPLLLFGQYQVFKEGFLRYFGYGFFKGKEMGYYTKLIKRTWYNIIK